MSGTPSPSAKPTVVFVHGAFADASGWMDVIKSLQADGINAWAPANPLQSIAGDSTYLDDVLGTIPGPVLLVGHSYGGAVISASKAANAIGLVYVAAFAPDEGETLLGIQGGYPPTPLGPALRPASTSKDHVELLIDPAQFHNAFCADLPDATAAAMAVSQRPIAAAAFQEKAPAPAWKKLPSWFAVGAKDNAIGAPAEQAMAKRAGSTTVEIDGSHVLMISQPAAITDLVKTALAKLA